MDLMSGFHIDPLTLLRGGHADVVISPDAKMRRGVVFAPLFHFEILAVLPVDYALCNKK